jgi:hypothetical protein
MCVKYREKERERGCIWYAVAANYIIIRTVVFLSFSFSFPFYYSFTMKRKVVSNWDVASHGPPVSRITGLTYLLQLY